MTHEKPCAVHPRTVVFGVQLPFHCFGTVRLTTSLTAMQPSAALRFDEHNPNRAHIHFFGENYEESLQGHHYGGGVMGTTNGNKPLSQL